LDLPLNSFKQALREGRPQIGLWSSLPSPIVTEVIAQAGFDWILLDTEHSPNDLPTLHLQLMSFAGTSTEPIVRPGWSDMVEIKRLLDLGVRTLLVPFINNAEEARRAVSFTRYPPQGIRGFAGSARAMGYGRVSNYHTRAAEHICLLVQVETPEAYDNIEAICEVDGIDGAFIGPQDFAATHGFLGQYRHPEMQERCADAIRRIRASGKAAGILAPIDEDARRWLNEGALFVSVGSDVALLAKGADTLASRFRL
jgi:4-hydroxy-2-oxoheptanedioate aldolase